MDETNSFISNFEIRDARRLLGKIFLFTPALLLVVAVNISVDPAGLYRKIVNPYERYEYHLAQTLAMGENVRIDRPIDDRLLQEYFVEDLTAAPDIVVLGSSRSYWLGDNVFPGKKVVNNSVEGAVLPDYLGIFELYAKKNLYPKRVICLLDPQMIGSPIIYTRWDSIKENTYGMLNRLGVHAQEIKQPVIPPWWLNVFSFTYFQRSIEKLRYGRNQHAHFVYENTFERQLLFKDGRRLLPWGLRSWDTEKMAINRFLATGESIRGLDHGTIMKILRYQMKPDKELEGILEDFIRYLMAQHIQVTLCLLPYHPQLYKGFLEMKNSPGALDVAGVEQYYRSLARRLNLEIVGSYDPAACNLDGRDFYDGDHMRDEVLENIFKQKGSLCSMTGL